jgi:hypothetical protein
MAKVIQKQINIMLWDRNFMHILCPFGIFTAIWYISLSIEVLWYIFSTLWYIVGIKKNPAAK